MTPSKALAEAIQAAGGQQELAELLGVTRQAVYNWVHIAPRVPVERVLDIERTTGISRHDLRPDIYPREVRGVA